MYGLSPSSSNHSATCSRNTAGANGRNDSRNLILRFITACIFGDRASPMIDRAPSARGPNSIRPCSKPTTFASAIAAATSAATPAGSTRRATHPPLRAAAAMSVSEKRGPRNDPLMPSAYLGVCGLGAVRCQSPAASGLTRGLFKCRCHKLIATPSAPPASPAAG
jgi:hypothetical protein